MFLESITIHHFLVLTCTKCLETSYYILKFVFRSWLSSSLLKVINSLLVFKRSDRLILLDSRILLILSHPCSPFFPSSIVIHQVIAYGTASLTFSLFFSMPEYKHFTIFSLWYCYVLNICVLPNSYVEIKFPMLWP